MDFGAVLRVWQGRACSGSLNSERSSDPPAVRAAASTEQLFAMTAGNKADAWGESVFVLLLVVNRSESTKLFPTLFVLYLVVMLYTFISAHVRMYRLDEGLQA